MASTLHTRRAVFGAMALAPAVLAVPALAATAPSSLEAIRLEYIVVQKAANIGYEDEDPRFLAMCERLNAIEHDMVRTPCRSLADARAKMRFVLDLHIYGTVLDGDDAHDLVKDISRFML